MDLKTWCAAERGRTSLLASGLRLPASFVSQMAAGQRSVPVKHCQAIEVITLGAVRRWDLRPSDWWQIWPELVQTAGAPEAPALHTPAPASTSSHAATLPVVTVPPAAPAAPSVPITGDCRAGERASHAQERQRQDKAALPWPQCGERREATTEVPGSSAAARRNSLNLSEVCFGNAAEPDERNLSRLVVVVPGRERRTQDLGRQARGSGGRA